MNLAELERRRNEIVAARDACRKFAWWDPKRDEIESARALLAMRYIVRGRRSVGAPTPPMPRIPGLDDYATNIPHHEHVGVEVKGKHT